MESLSYVDTLFKEYLLFRGFTATLQAFNADLSTDRGCGFQVQLLHSNACLMEKSQPGGLPVESFYSPEDVLMPLFSFTSCSSSAFVTKDVEPSNHVGQAEQISSMVFNKLIRQSKGKQLQDMLSFLNSHLYCHLNASYEPVIRKMEACSFALPSAAYA